MSADRPGTVPPARHAVLAEIATFLAAEQRHAPRRVAVDGRDGAGKTVFADELAAVLQRRGVPAVRLTIDRFHHPRSVRYRRGRDSPEGFYLDSYDLEAFQRGVLDPLGAAGDRRVLLGTHDVETDRALPAEWRTVPAGAVVLVDGIFLHRSELRAAWDVTLYLQVDAETGLARCAVRDGVAPGVDDPRNRRYAEGQRLYHEACRPTQLADWVIDNAVLDAPRILRRPAR